MRCASRLQIHRDRTSPSRRGIKPLEKEKHFWSKHLGIVDDITPLWKYKINTESQSYNPVYQWSAHYVDHWHIYSQCEWFVHHHSLYCAHMKVYSIKTNHLLGHYAFKWKKLRPKLSTKRKCQIWWITKEKSHTKRVELTQKSPVCRLLCRPWRWSQTPHWEHKKIIYFLTLTVFSGAVSLRFISETFKLYLYFVSLPINWTIHRKVITEIKVGDNTLDVLTCENVSQCISWSHSWLTVKRMCDDGGTGASYHLFSRLWRPEKTEHNWYVHKWSKALSF